MGTITCRPYLDEMIAGSQISGMTIEERIKAAENGDQDAMESLANSYLNGNETEQDFRKSFKWWKKLAEEGSAIAQFNTGLYLAKGLGVKRDFGKAVEWMEKQQKTATRMQPDTWSFTSQLRIIGGRPIVEMLRHSLK